MENRKQPEIRFSGYTDDWKEHKLGETLKELKSGLSRMLSNTDIGLPVVRANNINNGQFNMDYEVKYWYVDDPQGANTSNYLIKENDILINFINSEAKMGTATVVENTPIRDTIYTTNILRARVKDEYDSYYWFTLTQTNRYKINIKIITKPAVNQASFTTVDLKKLSFMFPSLKEQEKIGQFFKQLDNTIALHQRKLELLKEQKKGFLQKMFPKAGAKTPEVRFAGFTDDWDQRKLSDISKVITKGTTPKDKSWTGPVNYVKTESIDKNSGTITMTSNTNIEEHEGYLKRSQLKNGDVLFSIVGTLGRVGLVKSIDLPANTNQQIAIIRLKNEIDKFFIFQLLKTPRVSTFIKSDATIGAQPSLSLMQINNLNIFIPKELNEQKKIGLFFKQLDDIIVLHQQELESLKETKKGFLQKMFV